MKYPVVFIHEGNQEYLSYAIKSAYEQNLNVFLIGNEENKKKCKNWISINEFDLSLFDEFKKYYKHMSSNDESFELLCFKRYFLLLEFMKKNKLLEILMLDSDTLIYSDFSEYPFSNYSAALSTHKRQENYRWSTCPHFSYWTKEALEEFIYFCINTYKKDINVLEEKFCYHKKNSIKGGICDMTLLYLWIKDRNDILNLSKIYNGGVIDNTIASDENYLDKEYKMWKCLKIKVVKYDSKIGYYFVTTKGEKIKVRLFHFQGSTKNLMESIYNKNILKMKINRLKYFIERVIGLCLKK